MYDVVLDALRGKLNVGLVGSVDVPHEGRPEEVLGDQSCKTDDASSKQLVRLTIR